MKFDLCSAKHYMVMAEAGDVPSAAGQFDGGGLKGCRYETKEQGTPGTISCGGGKKVYCEMDRGFKEPALQCKGEVGRSYKPEVVCREKVGP